MLRALAVRCIPHTRAAHQHAVCKRAGAKDAPLHLLPLPRVHAFHLDRVRSNIMPDALCRKRFIAVARTRSHDTLPRRLAFTPHIQTHRAA